MSIYLSVCEWAFFFGFLLLLVHKHPNRVCSHRTTLEYIQRQTYGGYTMHTRMNANVPTVYMCAVCAVCVCCVFQLNVCIMFVYELASLCLRMCTDAWWAFGPSIRRTLRTSTTHRQTYGSNPSTYTYACDIMLALPSSHTHTHDIHMCDTMPCSMRVLAYANVCVCVFVCAVCLAMNFIPVG